MPFKLFKRRTAAALLASFMASGLLHAQTNYPIKPIRWIVPYAAGGLTDKLARDYADKLQRALREPVIVENRPGATTEIGMNLVLAAPADGYTLFTLSPPQATGAALYPNGKWPEDPLAVFEPVSMFIKFTNVLVASTGNGITSVQSLIDEAKGKAQPVLFGSPGIGTAHHIAALQFGVEMGIKMRAVPYKGSAPLMTDLLGDHIRLAADNLSNWVSYQKSGQARVLVILGPNRSPLLPDVPSMADLGHPDFEGAGWQGLVVKKGTPHAIVEKLSREIQRITASEDFKKYELNGDKLVGGPPEQFAEFIRNETRRSRGVIRAFGIKPE